MFVPFFPPLEARSCEPEGSYSDSGTFDADGMMAVTTMPPASNPAPRGTAAGSSAGMGMPGLNVLHCSKQGPKIQHGATSGGVPPRWPSTPFAEWGRWPRRRNADRIGLRSPVATMLYRLRVPVLCVLWKMCICDDPPQGCGCRLALPRVSIQPGVAYGDLHFPGCPFSPGLLPGVCPLGPLRRLQA